MSPARRSPRRAGALPLLLWLLAAGCAATTPNPPPRDHSLGAPPPGQPAAIAPADSAELEQLAAALADRERALNAAHAESAPDCDRVCPLANNVCTLAQRICAIAARYPDQPAVAATCADARTRCQRARQAASERCPCPPDR